MLKADVRTMILTTLKRAAVGSWAHPNVPLFSTVCKTLEAMRYDKVAVKRLEEDKFQVGARKDVQFNAVEMTEWLLSTANGPVWAAAPE